ncbi:type II toxin-antitoxin system VapC family toxin [Haloplanus rubicundus]|uniref:Type II toxin-antitoxin system VapC family toxin n=1 Tax=Haloplanus rubicundus TaxID=1547898 RepID=A0A345E2C2_9EURY|nr:PIN domain-containing protein [Haloplanus rubicundus]AXG06344.1 type II toxin-antitoxin system VapC family toxin [Haloplanus rubicundus]AXG09751.1 type II toxin-antitoxin system VapC family toxin [Haloplanus rubicundus]
MIIDSSYLFDLMAEDPDAFSKGAELVEDGEMQWLPTPVVAEAYYGVFTARSNTTEKEVRNRILGYPRIDVDEEIARKAGKLLAAADDRGGGNASVGTNDGYIAAMADVLDDAVLTDNVEDFEALGVPVETY